MRKSLWALAAVLAVPILLFGAYFFRGSLEDFPTVERQAEVRLVSGVAVLIFALLETAVIATLLRGKRSGRRPLRVMSAAEEK